MSPGRSPRGESCCFWLICSFSSLPGQSDQRPARMMLGRCALGHRGFLPRDWVPCIVPAATHMRKSPTPWQELSHLPEAPTMELSWKNGIGSAGLGLCFCSQGSLSPLPQP